DVELNKVKLQQIILNNIEEYIRKKENLPGTVPATLGITDPFLISLLNQLLALQMQRELTIKLVAKADNPLILAIDEQIRGIKKDLSENIQSLRENLALTRQQYESEIDRVEAKFKTIPGKERALMD